jgi:hypothetical protein
MRHSRHTHKSQLIALVLLAILFTVSASSAYAFMPGESAVIVSTMWQINAEQEKSKYEHFFETLAEIKKQLIEAKQQSDHFRTAVTGKWQDPMQVLRDDRSRIVALGMDLKSIGWQPTSETANAPVLQRAEDAIRYLDAAGRGEQEADGRQLRDSLEDLYEVSNATRTGGRSEAAYREMATAYSTIGELSKQIKEQNKIYDEAYDLAQQGGLSTDEVQRLEVLMQVAQGRQHGLQMQLDIQQTRLQMQGLGIQVAQNNQHDREILDDRAKRVSAMNAFQLGPGQPTVGQVARQY